MARTVIAIIAAFSIATGIMEIIVAVRDRKVIQGEGWMVLNGICVILFGFIDIQRVPAAQVAFSICAIGSIVWCFLLPGRREFVLP